VQQGDIFIALKGSHVDGHNFIDQALDRGVAGFIAHATHREAILQKYGTRLNSKMVLFVTDSLQTLLALAHAWRSQFTYPVIGITGTVGKTTTKEIIRNILRVAHKKALVSHGNQNTLIGVSLNILKMRAEHDVAVFELGISQQGSMKELVSLVRPTSAVITQIGHGHMQGLGDIDLIAQEKRDVFSYLVKEILG
jgi:UDP-N-acetylmuramoyl-tripeptide--D-alanyl-D-alanine ligase